MRGIAKKRMMKCTLVCSILLMLFSPAVVSANSSWRWVTMSPMKALPVAVVLTLVVETIGIIHFGQIASKLRAFIIVAIANIASFLAPYLYSSIQLKVLYGEVWFYALERSFNNGPNYIVRSGFLLLTLCIEMPLVYFLLRKCSKNKKALVFTIFITNVITTVLVGVLERIICKGQW